MLKVGFILNHIYDIFLKIKGINYNKEYGIIHNITNENEYNYFQEESLKKLFNCSNKNVEYYHKLFKRYNIDFNENLFTELNKLPILTKTTIRSNEKKLTSKNLSKNYFYNKSGGSTGEPLRFIQDNHYLKWANAINYYYYKDFLEIDEPASKKVVLWGSAIGLSNRKDAFKIKVSSKLSDLINNRITLNSFKMKKEDIENYINIINRNNPDLIRGYAGPLYEICKYAEKKNIEIKSPKVVVSAAESLRKDMREKIEEIFGTKVFDFYGSREIGSIAGECEKGSMHILPGNYVEIVDRNNKPLNYGENGKIVITNFFNHAMPFIKYEIGDMAILNHKKCECGSHLPTFKKLSGRITDHFILKDGTFIPAEFFIHLIGVIYNNKTIEKFQVIQEDYDKIRILIVLNEKKEANLNVLPIENKIRKFMGKNCKIQWDFVDKIEKTKSGKYLYTRSLINN